MMLISTNKKDENKNVWQPPPVLEKKKLLEMKSLVHHL